MAGSGAFLEVAAILANASSASTGCVPAWSREGKPCPHGFRVWLPMADFTLPIEMSAATVLACCYSILPFFATAGNIFLVVQRKRPRELMWLLFALSLVLANDMLRSSFQEPRPETSCIPSCGMPAGGSCYAVGLFLFMLMWDSVSRSVEDEEVVRARYKARGVRAVALTFGLLPIAWAQVHLGDHSVSQVFIGGAIGVLGAASWLACLGLCLEGFLDKVMRRLQRESMPNVQTSMVSIAPQQQRKPQLDRTLISIED